MCQLYFFSFKRVACLASKVAFWLQRKWKVSWIVLYISQGLKANLKRLYNLITEQQFTRCHKPYKYKKLLFCLCFFHSVLLERKKFLTLGWNIAYEFNDSDFEVRIRINFFAYAWSVCISFSGFLLYFQIMVHLLYFSHFCTLSI